MPGPEFGHNEFESVAPVGGWKNAGDLCTTPFISCVGRQCDAHSLHKNLDHPSEFLLASRSNLISEECIAGWTLVYFLSTQGKWSAV